MIVFNKKLSKNLCIFSDGSLLINIGYNKQIKNSNYIFLEKDLKSFESFSKNKFYKSNINLNTSINYRKLIFK